MIADTPVPCGAGILSILLPPIVHIVAVALCDSSSQKVTIPLELMSQCVKSGLMTCFQILCPTDNSWFKGELGNVLPGTIENSTA